MFALALDTLCFSDLVCYLLDGCSDLDFHENLWQRQGGFNCGTDWLVV